jgi:SEC-C motif-containing protein
VRARFSAFACGDGAYLWRTTHPDHPLRARPRDEVVRELSQARRTLRYRELTIHASETDVERGRARVLFTARVFEKGRDRSFVELSDFAIAEGGWRYLDGLPLPRERLAEPPTTIEAFEAALTS